MLDQDFCLLHRQELVGGWTEQCLVKEIPCTKGLTLENVLADPFEIRQWNTDGLPRDQVSTENAVLVTRARRWPLMIDPQEQVQLSLCGWIWVFVPCKTEYRQVDGWMDGWMDRCK